LNDKYETVELNRTIVQIIEKRKPQSVAQLITLVEEQLHLPKDRILDTVLKLQNQGTIKLKSQISSAAPNFAAYLKTHEAIWYWSALATATITVALVLTAPEGFPWNYLRSTFGIIFVLLLPGYAFIKALFPAQMPIKTSTQNLDTIERIALGFGMSIALVPIVGLLLNYSPWGIRLTSLVPSLFALTLAFATAAVIREYQTRRQA
jgi:hypothetical protein